MRGGLIGGICFFALLTSFGIKGHSLLGSHYFLANIGPLNKITLRHSPIPIAAKFKRNIEYDQDLNHQAHTYTDVQEDLQGRTSADSVASTRFGYDGELLSPNGNTQTLGIEGGLLQSSFNYPASLSLALTPETLENVNTMGQNLNIQSEWKSGTESGLEERAAFAQAIANAQSSGNAIAQANAQAQGSTQAQANAQAQASTQTQANAQAYANVGESQFGKGLPYIYPGSASSSLAQALANANLKKQNLHSNPFWKSGDAEEVNETDRIVRKTEELEAQEESAQFDQSATSILESSAASVETLANRQESVTAVETSERFIESSERNIDEAKHIEENLNTEERSAVASGYVLPYEGSPSRVLADSELIDPNAISGQPIVVCSRPYEIHAVWLVAQGCMICTCVQDNWLLRPLCASCNTCLTPPPPPPPPLPEIIVPIPPPSPPTPVPQVSCDPLPTDTPFENPLNPCQICICKPTVNVFGQADVQIQCDENPQCMRPSDIIPIPPIPEPPTPPVPIPLCERFPQNVLFPDPLDACKICKCVGEPFLLEKRIICMPNPECDPPVPVPVPEPEPEPEPLPPIPMIPVEPYPIVPQVPQEIEPVPWPPMIPNRPHSPLPGPPPHDTCRPYPPNTPFQHPWDECQICECVEIYGPNIINIEVNCYTKPSCCIEPPIPEPLPLPGPSYPGGLSIKTLDPICEFQSLNTDFSHPREQCRICNCQIFGNIIVPVCRLADVPGCNVLLGPPDYGNVVYIEPKCRYRKPYGTFVVDCNSCYCQEVFQYVIAKCTRLPNCGHNSVLNSNTALASATALANSQLQGYWPGYPSKPGQWGSQVSSALAQAQAQAQNNAEAQALSNAIASSKNQYPYGTVSLGVPNANPNAGSSSLFNSYPYGIDTAENANAQAKAIAKAQSVDSQYNYPYFPGGSESSAQAVANAHLLGLSPNGVYPYSSGSSISNEQAQAEAIASAHGSGLYSNYPYLPGSSQSSAQADAIANTQSLGFSPYLVSPYSPGGGFSNAQAKAEAISNNQGSSILGNYPYLSGGSQPNVQALGNAVSNLQSLDTSPYAFYPYSSGGSLSNTQAQAEAISNGQNSQAQAEAIANTHSIGTSPYAGNPYSIGGGNSINAQAEAISNVQNTGSYGDSLYLTGGAQANAQAQAEAIANAQSLDVSPINSYPVGGVQGANTYPYSFFGSSQSNAQAQAEAIANAQSSAFRPYNLFNSYPNYPPPLENIQSNAQADAIATSQNSPNLYSLPSLNPLYESGTNGLDRLLGGQRPSRESLANAQVLGESQTLSQALAQGSASAQAVAQAAAQSGIPLMRSGPGLCQYVGDKYHQNCQACYCFQEVNGALYALCLGTPCA